MNIRVLRYFLAVAGEESITKGAEVLHVTQPTLSRQLQELEEELGTKLFERGSRKITLTGDGLLLRKRAREILDLVQKTEAELRAPKDEVVGDVYIGGGETHGMDVVAKAVKELREEHPRLRFHFYSGNAEDVGERLDKGLLDFGVLIEPANLAKYHALGLPATDVWGLLMRKDSPLAAKRTIAPEDLDHIPLIVSRQRLVGNAFAGWLKKDYEALNPVATYNLIYNASLLVEQGVGYALCLDKLAQTAGDSALCFRPLAPRLEAHLHLVWKQYEMLPKAAEVFLHKMQAMLA